MKPADIERIKDLLPTSLGSAEIREQIAVVNRQSSLASEKGNPMPQQNKVNLILLIAQKFTDEMCAQVLERFNNHPLLIANKLANEALNWDESKHPRASDGKFASVPGGGEKKKPNLHYGEKKLKKTLDEMDQANDDELFDEWADKGFFERLLSQPESVKDRNFGSHSDITTNDIEKIPKMSRRRFYGYKDTAEIRKYLDQAKKVKTKLGEGQTAREVLLEKLLRIERGEVDNFNDGSTQPGWYYKPGPDGSYDSNDALDEQLDIVEKLHQLEDIEKTSKLNQKRAKRYMEIDEEIDRLEEMYGDRDGDIFKLKWPKTQDADEDRKRYKRLVRERKKLDKQIDWKSLEDGDEEKDE